MGSSRVVVTNNSQNQFTKADVKYLEHFAYNEAVRAGRFILNQTLPTNPFIPEWRREDLLDIFETISLLLGTLGYPIFESYRGNQEDVNDEDNDIFYCSRRDSDAFGKWTNDGFVIFKGSKMSSSSSQGLGNRLPKHKEKIQRFVKEGVLGGIQGRYVFLKDQPFPTPSAASTFVIQSASYGWIEWKDKNGKTLDELKRRRL